MQPVIDKVDIFKKTLQCSEKSQKNIFDIEKDKVKRDVEECEGKKYIEMRVGSDKRGQRGQNEPPPSQKQKKE